MPDGRLPRPLRWLEEATAAPVRFDRAEVLWRASGLGRPGLIIQLTAPRLGTRLALGVEVPLAHHFVDRLLGFDRPFAQSRLQITPVEWGIWSFLALRALRCARRRSQRVRSAGQSRPARARRPDARPRGPGRIRPQGPGLDRDHPLGRARRQHRRRRSVLGA